MQYDPKTIGDRIIFYFAFSMFLIFKAENSIFASILLVKLLGLDSNSCQFIDARNNIIQLCLRGANSIGGFESLTKYFEFKIEFGKIFKYSSSSFLKSKLKKI